MGAIAASQLLAELAAYLTPEIEPDEITANMLAEYSHTNRDAAERLLKSKVAQKEMTRRWVKVNGGSGWAYRKTQPNQV